MSRLISRTMVFSTRLDSTVLEKKIQDTSRPLVISGPSGTGKSTLLKRLFDEHPDKFGFSVSHTTRAPRLGETAGVSYHYVSKEEFEQLIRANAFIEHAKFSNNLYGTTTMAVKAVADKGKRCILDIDMQGVISIKRDHPDLDPLYVFLSPPGPESLKARLTARGSETGESLKARIESAVREMAYAESTEPGQGHDLIIRNEDGPHGLEKAYRALEVVALGKGLPAQAS